MEKAIDRREYRRNNESENCITEDEIDGIKNKIKKVLYQTLGASILLLSVAFLKFYNCTNVLQKIESALNTKITISSIEKNGQIIYDKATNYYTKLNSFIDNMMLENKTFNEFIYISGDSETGAEESEIKIVNNISGEKIIISGEKQELNTFITSIDKSENFEETYEMAVEGINQMSEDAKFIKENYKMVIPVVGTITSRFGVRNSSNPIVSSYHSGLDIAANTGTQILAALDGEVIVADTDQYLGKFLKIKKDEIVITYAHCSKLLVKEGDKIEKGKLIAYVGNTGNSTGPHLHLEIRYNDRLVNPTDIIEI